MRFERMTFLVLSCLIHAVAGRTSPAGERGSAAGSLLSSHSLTILGPACCAGHHPSSPFALSGSSVGQRGILRSIRLLSCTCNTSYVRILMLFNIFLHPSRSPASSCHSGTSSSLSHGFTRRAAGSAERRWESVSRLSIFFNFFSFLVFLTNAI
jgi:hypothetical protein